MPRPTTPLPALFIQDFHDWINGRDPLSMPLAHQLAQLGRLDQIALGQTPLTACAKLGDEQGVRLLLKLGAKPNVANDYRQTPAMLASVASENTLNDCGALRALIQAGANLALRNDIKDQALHWACWGGCPDAARILLAAGADPNAKGHQGFTPLHYCAKLADLSLTRLLCDAGADLDALCSEDGKRKTPLKLALEWSAFHGGISESTRLLIELSHASKESLAIDQAIARHKSHKSKASSPKARL